jgi:AraC family transcriptional activator of pobA
MVIMDAKAQLKSTDLSIHDIAYSLNFTNMSFFGKYFKRHVGMGPLEYRNS